MGQKEYSQHQKSVITNYYQNLDTIMLNKLSELVTELYLTENEKKKEKIWLRAEKAMIKLKIKPGLIKHIVKTGSAEMLAENLKDWLKTPKKTSTRR